MKPGDVPAPASEIRDGLSSAEAAERLQRDGPNALPVAPPPPAWRLLAGQMVHFFALLLWGAGILAFIARMPELGVAIFAVVVINGLFAFAQEYRAERAAERLRDLLPRRANVVRDGKPVEIDADELVVGDVVLLGSGDRISADLRLIEAHALSIDTSTLTGESVPVTIDAGEEAFAGTFVVEGEGLAVVTATGSATRLASIAKLTRAGRHPRTPLAQELDRVVRTIAVIAVGVGGVFFVVSLLVGTPATRWSDGSTRWKPWARPPSSAPTRQAHSRETRCPWWKRGRRMVGLGSQGRDTNPQEAWRLQSRRFLRCGASGAPPSGVRQAG